MTEEEIKKEFRDHFFALRKILNSYELSPGSPSDALDGLNQLILGLLYKGAEEEKLARVLESELVVTYGFYHSEFEAKGMAADIMEWWNSLDRFY